MSWQTDLGRIQNRIIVDPLSTCWLWQGATYNGYGYLTVGSRKDGTRKTVRAHRYSFQAHYGEIPGGLLVCHKCDNRTCVRPDHLFLGTYQDNADDMVRKNRAARLFGEDNSNAKLSNEAVKDIISDINSGIKRSHVLKSRGITLSQYKDIKHRRSWRHLIPDPPVANQPDKC